MMNSFRLALPEGCGIILYAWNELKEEFKHVEIIGWLNVNGGRYVDVDGNHYEHVGDVLRRKK